MVTTHRLVLSGLGNVNRSLIEILLAQEELLRERYAVAFQIVGAADSGGAAIDQHGLDLQAVLAVKQAKQSVATLALAGKPTITGAELVAAVEADVLLEATPVDLHTAQPGLAITRAALHKGMHVVIANKGPVALAFAELAALSDLGMGQGSGTRSQKTPKLRFSACVGGFLPSINMGWRDLRGTRIELLEAVFNGTTQIILRAMEAGGSFDEALRDAQERGLAETDPTLDIEGWDAANKLVIFANAVLGQPTTLDDIEVTGITRLTSADLQAAKARDNRVVLLCRAIREGERYALTVRPTALPLDHPLARMSGDEMGLVFHTDISGRLSAQSRERGPMPTAAAMLRDLLEVVL